MAVTSSTEVAQRQSTPTAFRFGWLFATVWLVYLLSPLSVMVQEAEGWRQIVGIAALVTFATAYIIGVNAGRQLRLRGRPWPLWQRWMYLTGLVALTVALAPGAGDRTLVAAAFISAFAAASLPLGQAIGWVTALLLAAEIAPRVISGWSDQGYGFGVVLAAVAAVALRLATERNRALVAAQQDLANLALEEERSRIARDLHDILGHSLTVITVKAELAQRLLDVDLDRTRSELHDLEQLSRNALADVRATALSVRGVSLSGEVAQARSALEAAGIEAHLPTVTDDVPTQWREIFAWTVRECVTNVIRHSGARTCTIELTPRELRVFDDGVGLSPGQSMSGQGLAGLRRRVELAGATLAVGSGPDGRGLELRVATPS